MGLVYSSIPWLPMVRLLKVLNLDLWRDDLEATGYSLLGCLVKKVDWYCLVGFFLPLMRREGRRLLLWWGDIAWVLPTVAPSVIPHISISILIFVIIVGREGRATCRSVHVALPCDPTVNLTSRHRPRILLWCGDLVEQEDLSVENHGRRIAGT